jgi:hypothetical protein
MVHAYFPKFERCARVQAGGQAKTNGYSNQIVKIKT